MDNNIKVGTAMNCDNVNFNTIYPEATCRHNMVGCHFIQLLKFMYNINITYIMFDPEIMDEDHIKSMLRNGTIDVYARPIALRTEILDSAYPVQAVFMWRVGFVLRRKSKQMHKKFYRKPFHNTVWHSLFVMTFLAAGIFFTLSRWEKRLVSNVECSFILELLLAIGGFCQHIFPVETFQLSRRMAYFIFFLFSYVIYTSYTSNLLSHIVSDKEKDMDLAELADSGYNYMILDGIKEYQIRWTRTNVSIFENIRHIPVVNITTGLEAVRTNKTALLSDYAIVYREITKTFNNEEICSIAEVDLFSRVRKYLVTSKNFRFKEQMRVSTLRMQEAGILQRLTAITIFTPLECSLIPIEVTTTIEQISGLLLLFVCIYVLTGLILVCEIMYYRRYRLWPYVE